MRIAGRLSALRQSTGLVLTGAVLLGGCGLNPAGADRKWVGNLLGVEHWLIEPVRMRIYPSTRFVDRGNETILEARVELFDEMADSVKAVGQFRFELFVAGLMGQSERIHTWNVSALTLSDQRRYYDSITHAYLFPLKLTEPASQDMATLRVTFVGTSENRLETSAVVGAESGEPRPPTRPIRSGPEPPVKPD